MVLSEYRFIHKVAKKLISRVAKGGEETLGRYLEGRLFLGQTLRPEEVQYVDLVQLAS